MKEGLKIKGNDRTLAQQVPGSILSSTRNKHFKILNERTAWWNRALTLATQEMKKDPKFKACWAAQCIQKPGQKEG